MASDYSQKWTAVNNDSLRTAQICFWMSRQGIKFVLIPLRNIVKKSTSWSVGAREKPKKHKME